MSMKLTNAIKQQIFDEYNQFKQDMYAGKSLDERKVLDQFFTPPELTIQMIEKFDCNSLENKRILDPTSGSGNLLAACLIAGASPSCVFGNDYDKDMVFICRKRLQKICDNLGKSGFNPTVQIHQGNALQRLCLLDFSQTYNDNYQVKYIDDLEYAQQSYSDEKQRLRETQKKMNKEELW